MILETGNSYIEKGKKLQREGQLNEAVVEYRRGIELIPNFSWYHHNLGEVLAKLGDLDEAIASYQQAIKLNSKSAWSYHNLGVALLEKGLLDEALTAFSRGIEIEPDYYEFYVSLGMAFAKKGEWEPAIANYRKAIEINSKSARIYQKLGEALENIGEIDGAIANYQETTKLSPALAETYLKLGENFIKKHQFKPAIICLEKSIDWQPNNYLAYCRLGDSLAEIKNWSKAIAAYQKSVEIEANNAKLYCKLGFAFMQVRNWFEAVGAFRKAIELEPNFYGSHFQLGSSLAQLSNWSEAVTSFRNAIKLDSNNGEIHYQLGCALIQIGNLSEAISCLQLALELRANYYDSYYHLGNAFAGLGNWSEAITYFRRFLEYKPNHHKSYGQLGKALGELGNWSEAVDAYRRFAELIPNSFSSHYQLGNALAKTGNWSDAAAAYRYSIKLNPQHIKSRHQLWNALTQLGKWSQAIKVSRQSIKCEPNNYMSHYQLGKALARVGNWSEAVDAYRRTLEFSGYAAYEFNQELYQELEDALAELGYARGGAVYDRIWQGLNQVEPVDEETADYPTEIEREVAIAYFMQTSKYRVITLPSLTEDNKIILDNAGLSVANLQLTKQDVDLEGIYRTFSDLETVRLSKTLQQLQVETGYIYSFCPVTGSIIRSNQSFCLRKGVTIYIYRFIGGGEVFYLIAAGGMRFARKCLYFPERELIIKLEADDWGGAVRDIENPINWLKGYAVSSWSQVKSYISNSRKNIGIIFGIYNIGHNFWNEYTGVHSLYECGILNKVDKFFIGPNDLFYLHRVYPEIPQDKISRIPLEIAWEEVLSNNCLALMVFDDFVQEKLAQKTYKGSLTMCSPAFLQKVEEAKKHFPLLSINLRIHRRFWVSQVEGVANIINSLSEDFPNLGVVFDGWSRVKRGDVDFSPPETENRPNKYVVEEIKEAIAKEEAFIDSIGEEMILKENVIVEKILALIPPGIETYNSIGCMTYESAVWAYAIDLFTGVYGSGLAYVTWLANKPGVIHGNSVTLTGEVSGLLSLLSRRENAIKPRFLSRNDVKDVVTGNQTIHGNYDCDWKVIYKEIINLVKGLNPDR